MRLPHLFLLLLLSLLILAACGGEPPPDASASLTPITAANATQVRETTSFTLGETITWTHCLAWSPDSKYMAVGSEPSLIYVWDIQNGVALATLEQPKGFAYPTETLIFSPDGTRILGSGARDTVHEWDLATGKIARELARDNIWTRDIDISRDSSTLLTGGSSDWTGHLPPSLNLWNLETGELIRGFNYTDGIYSAVFSPDGMLVASGGADGAIRLWDVRTGAQLFALEAHQGLVRSLAFSPNGSLLASAGKDGKAILWDVASGTPRLTLRDQGQAVEGISFSPDATVLASGGEGGMVQLWDVATGTELTALLITATSDYTLNRVTALAFSPDGTMLAAGVSDGTVHLFAVLSQ